jgi:uncharacterized protein (DUF2235 family)
MKRIVVLIDGTWNKEGATGNTKRVHYHDGVGSEGDCFKRILGGAIGLGLSRSLRLEYQSPAKSANC